MERKVLPSERMNKALDVLLSSEAQTRDDLLGELIRRGSERILQEALEAEVTDFLGRGHYERASEEAPHAGYRNGYRDRRLKTSEGAADRASAAPSGDQGILRRHPSSVDCSNASTALSSVSSTWPWRCTCGACPRATSKPHSPMKPARRSSRAAR